jgi:uncharacterized protein (DUF885 family)
VTEFAARADAFLAEYFALLPVAGTAIGYHDGDGRWPDLSASGRSARLDFADRWTSAFKAFADADLDLDEQIDRDLLLDELASIRFGETELREDAWSPMAWLYLIGDGLFRLVTREFAPLADRLTSLAGRAEGLPEVLAAARETLVGVEGRPVDRLHTETALEQWSGLAEILSDAIGIASAAVDGDPAVAAVLPRLRTAADGATRALAAFEAHLRDVVLPAADGEGRLGEDLFTAKLRHTMQDEAITASVVRQHAEREFEAVRGEMIRIAREIAPNWLGNASVPDGDADAVRAVLDAIALEHPHRDELLDFCRAELGRIEAFCRERDLIGLADEPLDIRWTPVFMRAFGGAMLDWPGPLDRDQKAIFMITPIAADASPEEAESHLREDNDRMLRLLTIHEAVPGHYLQGAYANRVPSLPRAIFRSGVYGEGWAVYVTQVMIDAGYQADDPALLLTHWKFYLRSVTNALIDIGIHTAGMTRDEAIALMVEGGFQEESAARSKYDRARLSSTQLSTYFVGSLAFWDLELEVRRRRAAEAGGPRAADSIAGPRIVGDFGETPGFVYREHLEACLAHGAPPMPLLRRLVLG